MRNDWNEIQKELNKVDDTNVKFIILKKVYDSIKFVISEEKREIILSSFADVENNNILDIKLSSQLLDDLENELSKTIFEINTFNNENNQKINITFFPYKMSMWSSLESVYLAAKENNCINVKIVPLPYYEKQNQYKFVYEGDVFQKYSEKDFVHYSEYSFVNQIDIGFVHNIYDQYNTITEIHPNFQTIELKKNVKNLVFIPYHVSTFLSGENLNFLALASPSVHLVDNIIVSGENVKKSALKNGIEISKVHNLGSPQFDQIENFYSSVKEKSVKQVLLNTGCMFFNHDTANKIYLLKELFENVSNNSFKYKLIWRPHPLTKASIPSLDEKYQQEIAVLFNLLKNEEIFNNVIIDESDSYLPAINQSDILISNDGSLLRLFMKRNLPILFFDENKLNRNINDEIDYDSFYTLNYTNSLYKSLEEIDFDLKKTNNMKNLLKESYNNLDKNIGYEILSKFLP